MTICARGSFDYMHEDGVFPVTDIAVSFQDFHASPYLQVRGKGEFFPRLSVFDALFNVGPEETLKLIAAGTPKWLTWDEMLVQKAAEMQIELFNPEPTATAASSQILSQPARGRPVQVPVLLPYESTERLSPPTRKAA